MDELELLAAAAVAAAGGGDAVSVLDLETVIVLGGGQLMVITVKRSSLLSESIFSPTDLSRFDIILIRVSRVSLFFPKERKLLNFSTKPLPTLPLQKLQTGQF